MKFTLLLLVFVGLVIGIYAASDCETHRKRELSPTNKVPGRLIPECDANGDYLPMQCHGSKEDKKRFCQCWDKNGDILTSPSTKLKSCKCLVQQHQAPKQPGAYVPQCEKDGTYTKQQFHGSINARWCVDAEGIKLNDGECK